MDRPRVERSGKVKVVRRGAGHRTLVRYPARTMANRLSSAQVAQLLNDLCVDYGFCLPRQENERLKSDPPTEVDAFTDAVFVAEGMNPLGDLRLRRLVKKRVAKAFWDAGEPNAG